MQTGPGASARDRFDLPAAAAPLADLVVFMAVLSGGMRLASAHLVSFGVGTLVAYVFKIRGTVAASGRSHEVGVYAQLLAVALFAVFLRGGVLGLLTSVWGWPPQLAIVIAIAATLAVTVPGNELAIGSSWQLGTGLRWRTVALWFIVGAFALRLLYIGQVELIPEEAYYWNYGRHLDLSYLDHPPMVAWLIRLGTSLFGNTAFGVRVGALCTVGVAGLFSYRLTRNLFGEDCALLALVLMQALPFFFLAGMLTTPDVPLTAAWAGALYFLERALIAGHARAWLAAGACIGLGLISKYTIGMLVPAALLFVLLDRSSRRWLLRWEPYAALALAAAIFSPVIIWNARNEWASFTFQTARRLAEAPKFSLHRLILSALVLLTPTGFLTLLMLPVTRTTESAGETLDSPRRKWRFLQVCVLVPLAVFAVFSLQHDVKIDWTGTLWLAAVPALAFAILSFGKPGTKGLPAIVHAAWAPTAVIFLLLYGAGLHYLALGLPGAGYGSHPELVPVGWRDLARQIDLKAKLIASESGSEPLVIGMDRYETTSELAFYAADPAAAVHTRTSAHLFGRTGLMYERWFPLEQQAGQTLILVAWSANDLSDALIAPYVKRLGPIEQGALMRDGAVVHPYYYRIAYRFEPGPRK
jgi:dolichol-phosphate mannosyltransferase